MRKLLTPVLILCALTTVILLVAQEKGGIPKWKAKHQKIQQQHRLELSKLNQQIQSNPNSVESYSRRGDLHFFLAEFDSAVADYDKMVELSPALADSHWRRGIAWFYAERYKEAAAQFDRYHSFDDVDRENGIWRYLCHYKAYGEQKARAQLLKYEKDDREPLPSIYQMFAGETTPKEILEAIRIAKISETQRELRYFYAYLYIGLNHVVEKQPERAKRALSKMLPNTWGPKAGYGPNYMWEVGRLQYDLLQSQNDD